MFKKLMNYTLIKKSKLKVIESNLERCFSDNYKLKKVLEIYDEKYIGISADKAIKEAISIIESLKSK